MNSNNRLWRLLAMIFALSLFAAACGSDTDGGDTSSDAAMEDDAADNADDEAMDDEDHSDDAGDDDTMEDDTMEEAAPAVISEECAIPNPAELVEIDVMGWEFPITTQYAAELEDCTAGNYAINYQFLDSTEARNAMTADAATGSPTFELYQGSNSFIAELANQGFLMPLNDLVAKYSDEYGLGDIDQAFWDMASIDGQIYAVPMVSNTMHLFYNEPKLAELGVEVPTNFEEAFAACEQIQAAGNDIGFLYMLSAGWAWQIEFESVLGSLGVDSIDRTSGQPNFNSPEGVAAATYLKDMLEKCAPNAAGSYSTDDVQAAFQTGEALLGHTWASRAAAMDDAEASTVVGEIQFAKALTTNGSIAAAPAYIDGWGIPVGVDGDVDSIFLAMLGATDTESQEAAAEFGLVTRTGIVNANGPRNAAAAESSLVTGKGADLTHPAAGIARAKLGDALVTILDGTSVEDALAAAEEAYLAEAGEQGLLG